MNKEIAKKIKVDFEKLTGINCSLDYMERGEQHRPSKLTSKEQGVYVFFRENYSFKVGKAGSNSQARWNSHHYNLDTSTPSTFPKSFMKDLKNFKSYFPAEIHNDMDNLNGQNIRKWVQNNLSRIEFKISSSESKIALNLLEAIVQFNFPPIYEGRNTRH